MGNKRIRTKFAAEPLEPRRLMAGDTDVVAPRCALADAEYFTAPDGTFEFAVRLTDPSDVDVTDVQGRDDLFGVLAAGEPLAVTFVSLSELDASGERVATYRTRLENPDPNGTAVSFSLDGALRDTVGNATEPGEFTSAVVYPLDLSDAQHPNVVGVLKHSFVVAGVDRAEPLANVRVYVDTDASGTRDDAEPTTVTDAEGAYAMKAPLGGTVRVDVPDGWTTAAGSDAAATIGHALLEPSLAISMASPVVVTVLVAVTESSSLWQGGEVADQLQSRAADLVAGVNRVLGNSKANALLDLAGTHVTASAESSSPSRDLTRLKRDRDGSFDDVHAARDRVAADVVVLVTDFAATAGANDTVGIAYQLLRAKGDPASGFAVVTDVFDDAPDPYGNLFAHEVGHVLGAGHDLATTRGGITRYAHGYVTKFVPVARDIMAYGSAKELPFYSSPDVFHNGEPLGDAATADNARVIREVAPLVATYRQTTTQANLAVTSVVAPKLPAVFFGGERVAAVATIGNGGTRAYVGPATVDYFLSPDGTTGETALLLKSVTKKFSLGAGRSLNLRAAIVLPGNLAEQGYAIVARVTPMSNYVDGSSADDAFAGPTATFDLPFVDPALAAFAPPLELKLAGQRVVFTLSNLGNVKARFRGAFELIFSADGVIDGTDLVSTPIAASVGLKAQATKTYAATTKFGRELVAGTYTLFVRFVPPLDVVDVNADNNVGSAVVALI